MNYFPFKDIQVMVLFRATLSLNQGRMFSGPQSRKTRENLAIYRKNKYKTVDISQLFFQGP